jgi:integrase
MSLLFSCYSDDMSNSPRNRLVGSSAQFWQRVDTFLELRSKATAVTYRTVVDEWCRYLNCEAGSKAAAVAVASATDDEAAQYRSWLAVQPGQKSRVKSSANGRSGSAGSLQSNATIHKKFAVLRRLYRALIAADLGITVNPFDVDRVPPPPKESGQKRPTEMVDYECIMSIIAAPNTSTRKGLRDSALLAVLFGGGLRRGEAATLRLADVRKTRKGSTFLVLRATKSGKDAEQALPLWAAELVHSLVQWRKRDGASEGDFLFLSFGGRNGDTPSKKAISTSGVYQMFKHYVQLVGGNEFASPHSARATAITKLLDKGLSHREVKAFSRHSSIQMVEVYDKRRIGVDESPALGLEFD